MIKASIFTKILLLLQVWLAFSYKQSIHTPMVYRMKALSAMPVVPYYPNKGSKDYQWMDIYNALGRERTLFVGRFLDEENCNQLIASLIWLQG